MLGLFAMSEDAIATAPGGSAGTVVGVAAANAAGLAIRRSAGAALGAANASASAKAFHKVIGNAVGAAVVLGGTDDHFNGIGTAIGIGTVSGIGRAFHNIVGSVLGIASASGRGKSINRVSGTVVGAAIASGRAITTSAGAAIGAAIADAASPYDAGVYLTLAPTESEIFSVLRAFLVESLPTGTEVILAQGNRVPEPSVDNFVVMTPIRRDRIETNVDAYLDCAFTGLIAGAVLTVTVVRFGFLGLNNSIYGALSGTTIGEQLSGIPGGAGTYTVSPAQTVSSGPMWSGSATLLQPTEFTVQLDVHGSNSGNNAQVIATLFRDEYATSFFALENAAIIPLYADDPRQMPFINDQQQYEWRWVIEAKLQVNETVTIHNQQFADSLAVQTLNIETLYP